MRAVDSVWAVCVCPWDHHSETGHTRRFTFIIGYTWLLPINPLPSNQEN